MPGNNAARLQGVLSVFLNSIIPEGRQFKNGAVTIFIHIDVVPCGFFGYGIASSIGVDGSFRQVLNILFIEPNHLWWKSEYSQPVNFLMTKKSPTAIEN